MCVFVYPKVAPSTSTVRQTTSMGAQRMQPSQYARSVDNYCYYAAYQTQSKQYTLPVREHSAWYGLTLGV
eukprot:3750223-Rhodomonas_salina.2